MAETGTPVANTAEPADPAAPSPGRSKDDVALEMMKFIAVQTGYGKAPGSAGFSGKPTAHTAEAHADALIELFQKCRKVVSEDQ